MKMKKRLGKILTLVLAGALVLPADTISAQASALEPASGLCSHHTEHEGCGYTAGIFGHPCDFVCEICDNGAVQAPNKAESAKPGDIKAQSGSPDSGNIEQSGSGPDEGNTISDSKEADVETGETKPETETSDTAQNVPTEIDMDAIELVHFEALSEDILNQEVLAGTALDTLILPEELNAVGTNKEAVVLTGVLWEPEPEYDGESAGQYVFTPILPEGYVLGNGTKLPSIVVTVTQREASLLGEKEGQSIVYAVNNKNIADVMAEIAQDSAEAAPIVLRLTEDITASGLPEGFKGAEGRHITLESGKITDSDGRQTVPDDSLHYEIKIHSDGLVGDVTLDNVKVYGTIYANGHRFETTQDFTTGRDYNVSYNNNTYIYGGSKTQSVASTELIINGGAFNYIYGGGNKQDVSGDTKVTLGASMSASMVYGGGSEGNVAGNVYMELNGDTATGYTFGSVFGGGYAGKSVNKGCVGGNITLNFNSGSAGSIHGGGSGDSANIETAAKVSGTIRVKIGDQSKFGPGKDIKGATVTATTFYGGGASSACQDIEVVIENGAYLVGAHDLFGGSETGRVNGAIKITMNGGYIDTIWGGNEIWTMRINESKGMQTYVMNESKNENAVHVTVNGGTVGYIWATGQYVVNGGSLDPADLPEAQWEHIYGNALIELNGGLVEHKIRMTRVPSRIHGNSTLRITGGALSGVPGIYGREGSPGAENINEYLTEGGSVRVIFDGCGQKGASPDMDTYLEWTQLVNIDKVILTNGALVSGVYLDFGSAVPFFKNVNYLTIEGGSTLALDGVCHINKDFYIEKGSVLALNRVKREDIGVGVPEVPVVLDIGGTANGEGSLYTIETDKWLDDYTEDNQVKASTPIVDELYVRAAKNGSGDPFILKNEDEGLYVKRIDDTVDSVNRYAWVIAKETRYSVLYEFKCGTRGASLPDAVTDQLPLDSDSYAMGETVTAIWPEEMELIGPKNNSAGSPIGVWKFTGYDSDSKVVNEDNLESGKDPSDEKRYIIFTGTWTWEKLEDIHITITPQDMTAYTGGDSMNGDSFPTARYKVEADTGVDLSAITFTVNGDEKTLPEGTKSGDIVLLPWLDEMFILQEDASMGLSALSADEEAVNDIVAGVYEISVDTENITASSENGAAVKLNCASGTLTVRYVSDPDGVLSEAVDVAQPVVSLKDQVNTDDGIGIAVIPEGTGYYTNGKEELGVLGDNDSLEPQIALLFDELLPGENGEDTKQLLIDRADQSGYTLTDENSQFKYLDLINENDGNAWVSTDDNSTITIYWPCPENMADNAEYSVKVLHFKGLHREYRGDLENQVQNGELEELSAHVEDGNIIFELKGNKAGGSFSPFAVVWEEREPEETDTPDTSETEESDTPDTSETEESDTPDTSETEESAMPDTSETEESDMPDTSETEESDTPDTSETEESDTPDTSDTEAPVIPDTSETEQSETTETVQTSDSESEETHGASGNTNDTAKPSAPGTDSPKTGDETRVAAWFVVFGISAFAIISMLIISAFDKKGRRKKKIGNRK